MNRRLMAILAVAMMMMEGFGMNNTAQAAERDAALIYKTPTGTLKDNCVFWHEGTFYLLTMYAAKGKWDGMWAATSKDGVHWQDVGPVIKDAPFIIWAMRVWRAGDRFILNHGSFSDHGQAVLRFWESEDLIHWKYLGEEYDVRRPDGGRIDAMSVLPGEQDGKTQWHGYATGGMLRSEDGVKWRWVGDYKTTDRRWFPDEAGACERFGDKYYLLTGLRAGRSEMHGLPGDANYGTYTFIADDPAGPFRPNSPAVRLHGNSGTDTVACWAGFCRTPEGVLICNYMTDPRNTFRYWHLPLKRAVIDEDGHLRMGYWKGNDALKGEAASLDTKACRQAFPAAPAGSTEAMSLLEDEKIVLSRPSVKVNRWHGLSKPQQAVVMLRRQLDTRAGYVAEGQFTLEMLKGAYIGGRPMAGLVLETGDRQGKAILLHAHRLTEIGSLTWNDTVTSFECEDRAGFGCATVTGVDLNKTNTFRLLFRGEAFELYVNDLLVQTFHALGATGRIGLLVADGKATFSALKAWTINLETPAGSTGLGE